MGRNSPDPIAQEKITSSLGDTGDAGSKACFPSRAVYFRGILVAVVRRDFLLMSKDSTLVRQWLILKTLSARHYGVTVQEMAKELEVTDKTIRRDLETFKTVGMPIDEAVGDHGQKRWSIKRGDGQPELTFSMDEALAFYVARRFLEPLAGTLFWEAAQSAFKKIRACLGKKALALPGENGRQPAPHDRRCE